MFFLYATSATGGLLCLWLIARYGQQLSVADGGGIAPAGTIVHGRPLLESIADELRKNFGSPIGGFILQILTILVISRICGFLLRRLGQPRVVGEILAGILLGPSLLKAAFPEIHGFLFPESSLPRLFFLSNIGIVFFMFTIGLELDLGTLRVRAKSAVLIAHLSTLLPFVLGAALALFLFGKFGMHRFGFFSFALFLRISMSVTAFPVLARIVQEHDLMRTTLGTASITGAAVGDVTAWCILAVVVGIVQSGSSAGASVVVSLAVFYTAFALFAVRPARFGAGCPCRI